MAQPIKRRRTRCEPPRRPQRVYRRCAGQRRNRTFIRSERQARLSGGPGNAEAITFESPTSGRRVNRAWQMPESYEDLVTRRKALVYWAEQHGGFMGRSPDHLVSALTGQLMGLDMFEAHDKDRAKAFLDYYVYAR